MYNQFDLIKITIISDRFQITYTDFRLNIIYYKIYMLLYDTRSHITQIYYANFP